MAIFSLDDMHLKFPRRTLFNDDGMLFRSSFDGLFRWDSSGFPTEILLDSLAIFTEGRVGFLEGHGILLRCQGLCRIVHGSPSDSLYQRHLTTLIDYSWLIVAIKRC